MRLFLIFESLNNFETLKVFQPKQLLYQKNARLFGGREMYIIGSKPVTWIPGDCFVTEISIR